MSIVPKFDIFRGIPDRDAVWVCTVQGLASAKERIDGLAAEKPASYFIFFAPTREIVGRTATFFEPERVLHSHPQLEQPLEALRKIGYRVGELCELNGELCVAIDGQLRSYEEALHLLDRHKKQRA